MPLSENAEYPPEPKNIVSLQPEGMKKAKITGRLFAAFAIAFFVISNLPYQYVEVEPNWLGQIDLSESQQGGDSRLPVMGGWPLRYSIAYLEAGQLEYRVWQPWKLGFNILLGCFLSWSICWFLSFRFRSLSAVPPGHQRRLWFDSFFAFCILAVPLVILGTKAWRPYQQQKMARQLLGRGNVFISAWVPAWIDPHVPASLKQRLSEVRHVRLTSSTPALVRQIAEIPTLVSFHSYGGDYELNAFQKLRDRLHFDSLLVANGNLGDAEFESISNLPWLKHLKLPGTAVTSDQLLRFNHLPLVTVDIQGTGIPFSELKKVSWKRSCELLWLSRPPNGERGSLTLKDWERLQSLWVKRRNYELNDAVLGIRIEDLPQLRRLCLDRAQKHDLTLLNVPRLARIEEEIADSRFVLNTDYLVPGLTWVRNLEVSGADSLTQLGCYAKDLEQMELGELPNLQRLRIGAFVTTLFGSVIAQESDPEKSQRWISYLGQREGPYELDLGYLPLQGVDLTPLANNTEIHQLNLNGTYVEYSDLKQIGSSKKYQSLDARTTPLSGQQFIQLIEQFPQVEHLLIDGASLSHLDTKQHEKLKFLSVSTMREVEEISLVNQPKITTSLQMVARPRRLAIENVPGLRGLSLEGPWPSTSSLFGLRDLEWFAGGGVQVNDQLAEEILSCVHLHHLTFAYPSVSREVLTRVGLLKELVSLSLPGTPLDDQIVTSWDHVNDLWEANFNDTSVGAETVNWLASMSSLRRVSLNRIALNEEFSKSIVGLRQICELHLEESPISPEALSLLLRYGHLEVLNLTGWVFDEKLLDVLEKDAKGIAHLIIGKTQVDAETFRRLMAISDSIYVDTLHYPDQILDSEVATMHERADVLRRKINSGWRLTLESPQDIGAGMTRDDFLVDREQRIKQRRAPWMPVSFSIGLEPEKFNASSQSSRADRSSTPSQSTPNAQSTPERS